MKYKETSVVRRPISVRRNTLPFDLRGRELGGGAGKEGELEKGKSDVRIT